MRFTFPDVRDPAQRRLRLYKPIKESVRNARIELRSLLAKERPLPDFLVIGAQKAGTTSLFSYLTTHPHISRPLKKEIHYFDTRWHRHENWYRSHFPATGDGMLTGEASPCYLFYPMAPARVAKLLPDVRLIVLLRDPVARAYSHYQQSRNKGFETCSFEEAVAAEPQRLREDEPLLNGHPDAGTVAFKKNAYLTRGHYAEQLARWFEEFQREQFHIIKSEAFFADPQQTCSDVFSFLGLPDHAVPSLKVHNPGAYDSKLGNGDAALRKYFAPHNRALAELLGEDMAWR